MKMCLTVDSNVHCLQETLFGIILLRTYGIFSYKIWRLILQNTHRIIKIQGC